MKQYSFEGILNLEDTYDGLHSLQHRQESGRSYPGQRFQGGAGGAHCYARQVAASVQAGCL